jgi:hypothetical protein
MCIPVTSSRFIWLFTFLNDIIILHIREAFLSEVQSKISVRRLCVNIGRCSLCHHIDLGLIAFRHQDPLVGCWYPRPDTPGLEFPWVPSFDQKSDHGF